ncbi:MAG: hypothetical protein ACN4GR_07640 [Arenicellales bacterium]
MPNRQLFITIPSISQIVALLLTLSLLQPLQASEAPIRNTLTIKAITLIEKSVPAIHAEFSIQMSPGQRRYDIYDLPIGIVADSIKITPVDKQSPQINSQTLLPSNQKNPALHKRAVVNPRNSKAMISAQNQGHVLSINFANADNNTHRFLLSFQLSTITWQVDSDISIDGISADVTYWVSIDNASNVDLDNVNVTLIENTGLPSTQDPHEFARIGRFAGSRLYQNQNLPAWVKIYAHRVPDSVSIPSFSQTRALLYKFTNIAVKPVLIYEGMIRDQQYLSQHERSKRNKTYSQRSQTTVWEVMQLALSMYKDIKHPLPSAKWHIYNNDNHLIGTQYMQRMPPDNDIDLFIKPENELIASRKQLSFDEVERDKVMEETYKIDLKNPSAKRYTVVVREYLDRSADRSILSSSQEYTLKDNRLSFLTNVKPESATSITYTVRYKW